MTRHRIQGEVLEQCRSFNGSLNTILQAIFIKGQLHKSLLKLTTVTNIYNILL